MAVGLLAATSASAGGAASPARTVPMHGGVLPVGVQGGGADPANGSIGSSSLISPAIDLTGRR